MMLTPNDSRGTCIPPGDNHIPYMTLSRRTRITWWRMLAHIYLVASVVERCHRLQCEETMLAESAGTSLGCTSHTRRSHAHGIHPAAAGCGIFF
jgi:hypothetical protein